LDRKQRKEEAFEKRNLNKLDETEELLAKDKGLRPEWWN